MEFDVIVVGAGPAGAYTAYNLANANLDVLLLEKESLPRYKSCGGAISLKVAEVLTDIDFSSVIEDEVNKVVFSYDFRQPIEMEFFEPFTYTVMRSKFDNFLVEEAQKAGVKVIDNSKVVNLIRTGNKIKVKTNEKRFVGKFIVGADGVKSFVAEKLGLMTDLEYGIAFEKELKVSECRLRAQRGSIYLDYGVISDGYGWVFPKANHLSVGVGTYAQGVSLKKKLATYLEEEELTDYEVLKAKGHLLPVGGQKQSLNSKQGLLVGDAAGLVDPLSGEGIFYALKSGELASQVIIETLLEQASLDKYTEMVNREILPELKKAKLVSKIFFPFTKLLHKLFNRKEWILKKLIQIIYGSESYSTLYSSLQSEVPFLKFKK